MGEVKLTMTTFTAHSGIRLSPSDKVGRTVLPEHSPALRTMMARTATRVYLLLL